MTQLFLLFVVLAVATAFGLWRRSTDGRLSVVAATPASHDEGAPVPLADLGPAPAADVPGPVQLLSAADVGQALGERATLLQFSSAFCSPCRTTRAVLQDVATMVDGVKHIEVDAESHLELVRRVDVTRTPTVLVLDSDGRIRTRATGAPRRADVIAALGAVV